ncbi:glycosyltransferase [Anabaena subtropica FACHB-260]|uniref:Glycosyltransferase n=2 Tax=Anabaena TaxID=1163 RepID=A0ABR8CKN4_9NOST|nr:glycosyltransferase [Anabaena subtropica FACHB-260]
MKILVISPYLGASYGGISKIVIDLAQSLGKLGIHVDIVTTNANGKTKLQVPLKMWVNEQGYRVQYFPCWHHDDLILSTSLIRWLYTNVREYDLVHTHTIFAPLIGIVQRICLARRVPYLAMPHGMLEPWALTYKAWKKRIYYALLEKKSLQSADAICTSTTNENKQLKLLKIQTPAFTIPNGIYHQEFAILPNPENFYQQFPKTRNKTIILFLGRIDPKKGLDLLAPAFSKIYRQFPQIHLVVAGPDNIGFLPTIKKHFTQANCLEAVTFTGMLTGKLKYECLAAADIYISPSYSEGFSMSILEGMAAGLPCIITTGCNFPEAAFAQAAHVVDINSEAIANALNQCLSNPKAAKAMGNRARDFIFQNYTWECAAENLLKVYQSILPFAQSSMSLMK